MAKIPRYVLGLVKAAVLGVSIDGDAMVVRARPHRREQLRCPDEQPALPWEDGREEERKRDERKRRNRDRDGRRRRAKASKAQAVA